MRLYPHPKHRWSAPYLIFIVLIIFQSLSVGIIMLKQHGMGEEILLAHAKDMMRRLADGAIYNTSHHLQIAENVASTTKGLVKSDILSPLDITSFERYLLELLKNCGKFSGLSYGDNHGKFLYVTRQPSMHGIDYLTKIITFNDGARREEIIQRNAGFVMQSRTEIDDEFDPRTRPWYAAFKHQKMLWTPPYVFYTSRDPGITVSIPIADKGGQPIGAFGVDIEINSLSVFLAHRKISAHSFAFIVARDGSMAAHSNINLIKKFDEMGQPQLVNIADLSDDRVISTLWSQIGSMDDDTLLQGATLDYFVAGKKYLALVRSFPGNSQWPWLMTVVAPEDDFIGIFRRAKQRHLLQALLYSIGVTLIIFLLAARFLKPVRRLLHYAHFDPMTDLYNRRAFFESSEKLVSDARAKNTSLCLAMVDVDDFKAINDTYGHSVGDELLIAIAGRLRGALSDKDLIGRYGGEEFVLLLAGAKPEQGEKVCERLRRVIADAPIQTAVGLLKATISIGVSPLSNEKPDLHTTINQADQALLRAKKSGKNCVVLAG
jgi:diguanylate cyclase (GGDEF)-like protein